MCSLLLRVLLYEEPSTFVSFGEYPHQSSRDLKYRGMISLLTFSSLASSSSSSSSSASTATSTTSASASSPFYFCTCLRSSVVFLAYCCMTA